MTDNKVRAIGLIKKANEDQALAILALASSLTQTPDESIGSHTKGQCKRAIKCLRRAQPFVSDPQVIEDAVTLIRRDWMGVSV